MTTQQAITTVERNHAEAVLDVLYGVTFNDMNERFYRRIDSVFSWINMVGGSAAVAAVAGGRGVVAGVIGGVIAAAAYLEREIRPAQKAVRCAVQREKFGDLAARAPELTLAEIDRELRRLQANGPDTITALAIPAHNANLRTNGFENLVVDVPFLGRLACWIA